MRSNCLMKACVSPPVWQSRAIWSCHCDSKEIGPVSDSFVKRNSANTDQHVGLKTSQPACVLSMMAAAPAWFEDGTNSDLPFLLFEIWGRPQAATRLGLRPLEGGQTNASTFGRQIIVVNENSYLRINHGQSQVSQGKTGRPTQWFGREFLGKSLSQHLYLY